MLVSFLIWIGWVSIEIGSRGLITHDNVACLRSILKFKGVSFKKQISRDISKVVLLGSYSLNVNEWKFHSPIEWNSCKPLKKEWFCTLNSKFPLIKSENHSKKSELPLIWGVKRRTTRKRIVLRLTPQTSGNSLFLESFSLYMSGNLLFNVQNHSFLSGLQEFHSFGEWNFHSFTFREYAIWDSRKEAILDNINCLKINGA